MFFSSEAQRPNLFKEFTLPDSIKFWMWRWWCICTCNTSVCCWSSHKSWITVSHHYKLPASQTWISVNCDYNLLLTLAHHLLLIPLKLEWWVFCWFHFELQCSTFTTSYFPTKWTASIGNRTPLYSLQVIVYSCWEDTGSKSGWTSRFSCDIKHIFAGLTS